MQPIRRRALFILILSTGLVWIFLSADRTGAATAGRIPAPQKGFPAPEIRLHAPDGKAVALSDFRGSPILVNLWATWCPPCRAEMPAIEKLYQVYKDRGLVVLGVNATSQDNSLEVLPFVQKYGLTFPILLDEAGETARTYQLRSLPTSFFIGRDGIIREVVIGGPMSEALLRANLEEILQ